MPIQGIELIRMFDDYKIAVIVGPRGIEWLLIRASEDDSPLPGCIHRRAKFVNEFDAGMRVTLPIGSRGVAIGSIHKSVVRGMNGPLEEKMPVGDAIVCYRRFTGDGR